MVYEARVRQHGTDSKIDFGMSADIKTRAKQIAEAKGHKGAWSNEFKAHADLRQSLWTGSSF